MKALTSALALGLCAGLVTPGPIRGETIVLQQHLDGYTGVEDTWWDPVFPNLHERYQHYGGHEDLSYLGTIDSGARKMLIRFGGLESFLPGPGAQIKKATLWLYHYKCRGTVEDPQTNNAALYRLKRRWVEGTGKGAYWEGIDGATYDYWGPPTRQPAGWRQSRAYENVWELTLPEGETVDHCMEDRPHMGHAWARGESVMEVSMGVRRWYQRGSILYVNKNDETEQDPAESQYGFCYFQSGDRWDAPGAVGEKDIDVADKITAGWPDYVEGYSDPTSSAHKAHRYEGDPGWVSADVTEWVRLWQDHPDRNFGILIARNVGSHGKHFRSSEYNAGSPERPDHSYGPKLVVEYVPEPAWMLLLLVAAAAAGWRE